MRTHNRPGLLLLWLLLPLAACTHGHAAGVLHQRAPARGPDGAVAVAELIDAEGDAPTLALRPLGPCGAGAAGHLEPALAAAAAAEVRAGRRLEEVLPEPLRPPALAWSEALAVEGAVVRTERIEDRYGAHLSLRLVADGGWAELDRADARATVRFAAVPGEAGAVLARIDGPGPTRDLRRLDLAAGKRALHVARGEAALAAGDAAAALDAVAVARAASPATLCTPDGSLGWLEARAHAAAGAPAAPVIAALEEAIAAEPQRYRMYARTAPELRRYASDPAFAALVRPRPLQE